MNRLPVSGLGLVWALAALSADASVQLDIPPRLQWDNNNGYCGECSIQQIALYYGTYISQYRAREIIDPTQQQDVWVPENSGPILDALCLDYEAWDSTRPTPQYQAYLVWAKAHLQQGHPVIIDVFVQGETSADYDHIMPATGFTSVDATTYHANDALVFNDNYETTPYTRTFGSLYDTRAMNGNGAIYEYCIPRDTDYGCAVTGIKDSTGTALPVSLKVDRWSEPNISQGASPVQMNATVQIRALTTGNSYVLLRYNDYHQVPTGNYLSSAFSTSTVFTATNSVHAISDHFMSDGTAIYRCIPFSGTGTNSTVADLQILQTAPMPLVWAGTGVPPDPRGTTVPFRLTYAINNRGPASVLSQNHRYELYLSEDPTFSTADRKLMQAYLGNLTLAPWQQVSKASGLVSAYFPSDLTAGKYNVGVHAVLQAAIPSDPNDLNNWMGAGTVVVAPKAVVSFPVSFPGKNVLVVKVDVESNSIESMVDVMAPTEISMGELKPNRWYWVAFDVKDPAGVWQVAFATYVARFEGPMGRWIGALTTQTAIAPYRVNPPTFWMLFERTATHQVTTYTFELESRQMVWGTWQQNPAGWVAYPVPRFGQWFYPYVADSATGVWY